MDCCHPRIMQSGAVIQQPDRCCIPYCTSPPSTLHPLPISGGNYKTLNRRRKSWFYKYNQMRNGFQAEHPLCLDRNTCGDEICPLHFEESDFMVVQGGISLMAIKPGSIPSIFPWSPKWILLTAVQERHLVPASHFELLQKDGGMALHFCFMCEFSTRDLYAWDAHMRVHFNMEPYKPIKRQPAPDQLDQPGGHKKTSEPTKKQKLDENPPSEFDVAKVKCENNPHCIVPGCLLLEDVGLYLFPSVETQQGKDWMDIIKAGGPPGWLVERRGKERSFICSLHFSPFTNAVELDPDAKPSVFPWSPGWNRLLDSWRSKKIRVADEGEGSQPKDPPKSKDNPRPVPPSTRPTLSLKDKETQIRREETKLRRQMDELAQSMETGEKEMEQLRTEHAERVNSLRQDVKRYEGEEGECQGTVADLIAQKEAAKQRAEDLSARKQKVEGAINLMMECSPLSLEVANPDIPETMKPTLQLFQAENSALEKELGTIREKEKLLNASLMGSQETLSFTKQLLSLARKELNFASTTMEFLFRGRMQQLKEEQRIRIVSYCDLEKSLADLAMKRRLVLLDVNDAMKPDDV